MSINKALINSHLDYEDIIFDMIFRCKCPSDYRNGTSTV